MLEYITLYKQIVEKHDSIFQQCVDGIISKQNAIFLLEESETRFHETVKENTKMEINGMETTQDKIKEIENEMQNTFVISLGIVLALGVFGIILISRFISSPISNLTQITNRISKGEKLEIKSNSINSDVNDVLISLEKMSKDLEEYKSKLIKQEKLSSIGELASRLAHDIRNPYCNQSNFECDKGKEQEFDT